MINTISKGNLPNEIYKQYTTSFKYITHQPLLKSELFVVEKLLYKNKNQQKATDYYQKLKGISRLYKKYNGLEIEKWLTDLIKAMTPVKGESWEKIPNKKSTHIVLQKLLQGHILMSNALIKLKDCFIAFQNQVKMTYFMAMSLVCIGSISRIHHLTLKLMENIKTVYELLFRTSQKMMDSSCNLCFSPSVLSIQEYINWNFSRSHLVLSIDEEEIQEEDSNDFNDADKIKTNAIECHSNLSFNFWSQNPNPKQNPKPKNDKDKTIDDIFKALF